MSINESLETCAKYQEYKIDGRVRGEERERDLKKSWPKCSHVLGNICWRSAFVLNRKQDKFKKNHRELKVKTISLKRKRSTYEGRMVYCERQRVDAGITPQCSQAEYKEHQARYLYSFQWVTLEDGGERSMSSDKAKVQ